MLSARYLVGAGLMVLYIVAQSQNPPVTHSTNSDREKPTQNSQAAQYNSPDMRKESPIPWASQQMTSSDRTGDGNREKSDTQQERMWPPSLGGAAVLVAAVSALATIAYVIVSFWQWRVLREQNRPWIMVTPDTPKGWPTAIVGPCNFSIRYLTENVGKSPAFLTQLCVRVAVVPYPVRDNKRPNYGKPGRFPEFIIRPNGDHGHVHHGVLSEPEVIAMQAAEKCLLFYGFTDYRDTFKVSHRTYFCSYWRQEGEMLEFSRVGPPSYIKYT